MLSNMFENIQYVASRAIMSNICNIYPTYPVSSTRISYDHDWKNVKTGDIIYIQSSAIPDWRRRHLIQISSDIRFILVSGDCDQTVPNDIFQNESDFKTFINDPRIYHWFAQNANPSIHPKLSIIPIGLDYHTLLPPTSSLTPIVEHSWGPFSTSQQQEQLINHISKKAPLFNDRKSLCYSNFHFSINGRKFANDRVECFNWGKSHNDLCYFEPKQLPRLNTWVNQIKYRFVLSPLGGGFDCHRTWEALILGCIPIIRSSIINPLFDDLPVLIVTSWSDVTPELLQTTAEKHIRMLNTGSYKLEKLQLSYWKNLILSMRER